MAEKNIFISPEEKELQRQAINSIKSSLGGQAKWAMVETYGCQQNVNDSQRIEGMLLEMGFSLTDDREKADLGRVQALRGHRNNGFKAVIINDCLADCFVRG